MLVYCCTRDGVCRVVPLPLGLQTATAADVERADRELARLFLEMFDVIGEQVVRVHRCQKRTAAQQQDSYY